MRAVSTPRLLASGAILAAACGDTPSPQEPRAASPQVTAARDGRERAPARRDAAALLSDRAHWADGYLLASNPLTPFYLPSSAVAFNRSGGPVAITKPDGTTGRYVATFTGLSDLLGGRSTVHVTGYPVNTAATDDTYCKPTGASVLGGKVEVRCFKASTGLPANANFSLLVTRAYPDLAFAYAHLATSANYAPSSQGSWNPAGASRVTRTGVGQYRVTFSGLAAQLPQGVYGHVQVNAVGTSNAYCNAYNWGTNGATDVLVDVRCFEAPTGAPVDRRFTVLFLVPSEHLAYAWADKPAANEYSPSALYSSNPAGGFITIGRRGVGDYTVEWAFVDLEIFGYGNAQVTAFGANTRCSVKYLPLAGTSVRVQCFAPNGSPVDSRFSVVLGS